MNVQAAFHRGRPMSPWFDAFVSKYGAVFMGIGVGTTAKWALVLAEGRNLTWRMVTIDFLLAPMVALLTVYLSVRVGMDPHTGAMLGALFAVTSDRVVRLVRVRFLQKVDDELQAYVAHQRGLIREEVQQEISSREIISDVLSGKAPDHYKSQKTRKLD